jgi:DNA-binding MarR family transcriptional regulator
MVRHLELRGLISQAEGATSRHAGVFSLTPAGLELYARLHPVILAVRDRVMGSLSECERVTLQDLLAQVISANERKDRRRLS